MLLPLIIILLVIPDNPTNKVESRQWTNKHNPRQSKHTMIGSTMTARQTRSADPNIFRLLAMPISQALGVRIKTAPTGAKTQAKTAKAVAIAPYWPGLSLLIPTLAHF